MRVTARNTEWAGAELNRRHADFQTAQKTIQVAKTTNESSQNRVLGSSLRFSWVQSFAVVLGGSSGTRSGTSELTVAATEDRELYVTDRVP